MIQFIHYVRPFKLKQSYLNGKLDFILDGKSASITSKELFL